jgi:hypothetical protein
MPAPSIGVLALAGAFVLANGGIARAQTPPCVSPAAVALADRPGTGRATSTGGSPCVALQGELVVESGWRRQITGDPGTATLSSGPLGFVRLGVAKRLELGVAPPAPQSRLATGRSSLDTARGTADMVFAAKYLVGDTGTTQASAGIAYSPPSGSGEFTNGIPTYAASFNVGTALTSRLSFATSLVASTAAGADASGATRSYFVFAPSFTLAYAIDPMDTVLVQDALVSRQGPALRSGSRGFIALQRAIGNRLAIDVDYERNLAPLTGGRSTAVGFGFVWIAAQGHRGGTR